MNGSRRLLIAFALGVSLTDAQATSYTIGPADNLQASINALLPGDELILLDGIYTITVRLSIRVSGTPGARILIRAAVGQVPHLTRDPNQNVVNIEGADHVTLRGLEISGGSHGMRLNDASFITIEDCHVHDTGDVAISANIPGSSYEGLQFLRNHIHHTNGTGEGFYLGCNNNACTMFNSLIEGNHVHDTNQASVSQGDGIEIKQGSYGNVIRANLIHDTNYPCILVYGTEGNAVNLIERNEMWACGDHGIQVAADAIVRNNIILGARFDGIRNQVHQGAVPGNLTIVHNTILVDGNAIRTNDIAGPVLIANNALYSAGAIAIRLSGNTALATVAGNVGTGATQGVTGGFDPSGVRASDFVDAAADDVHLSPASRLIAAGDTGFVELEDFDAAPRGGIADVGAYRFATASCLPTSLAGLNELRVWKSEPQGVSFSWLADPAATEYHVNSVTARGDLAPPGPHLPPVPGGAGLGQCVSLAPTTTCVDVDGQADPAALLFYQVFSACGPTGTDEGPPH